MISLGFADQSSTQQGICNTLGDRREDAPGVEELVTAQLPMSEILN